MLLLFAPKMRVMTSFYFLLFPPWCANSGIHACVAAYIHVHACTHTHTHTHNHNVLTHTKHTRIHTQVSRCASVAFLMATLWILAPIPVPATALVPLILFPLMGVMDGKATAKSYFSDTQFVFIGSFLLAVAIEEAQLHRR